MGAELKTISTGIEFETDSENSHIGPRYGHGLLQHGRAYIGMRRYAIVDRAPRTQHGLKILCKLAYSHVIILIVMFLNLVYWRSRCYWMAQNIPSGV